MANQTTRLVRVMVKIDKGIPPPPPYRRTFKWPWDKMDEVGDSFLCPFDGVDEEVVLQRMQSQAHNASTKFAPKKFKAARHKRGIRVWRTV